MEDYRATRHLIQNVLYNTYLASLVAEKLGGGAAGMLLPLRETTEGAGADAIATVADGIGALTMLATTAGGIIAGAIAIAAGA